MKNSPKWKQNRLCIYKIHDKLASIDQYILCFLKALKEVSNHIVVAVDSSMSNENKKLLQEYADQIFECNRIENAYHLCIAEFLGMGTVQSYEELLLADNSVFGPFYSLNSVIEEMNYREVDFWGMTEFHAHIDSYFILTKKTLLQSQKFCNYWEQIYEKELMEKDEAEFFGDSYTGYFKKLGYRWDKYVKYDAESSEAESYRNFSMIRDYKCPVIKREVFAKTDLLELSMREDLRLAFDYIAKHTSYDTDMIWENILRSYNLTDIYTALHLNYVLPSNSKATNNNIPGKKRVGIIALLVYPELFDTCLSYFRNIPKEIELILVIKDEKIKSKIEAICIEKDINNYTIITSENRGRDLSALLVSCRSIFMNYDYLCFIHDKRTAGGNGPAIIGESYRYLLWDNMIKNSALIHNILDLFEKNPRLGILAPPLPCHADHKKILWDSWTVNYDSVKQLADELKLHVDLKEEKQPFVLNTVFWCRPKALQGLFHKDWKYSDFPDEPMPIDGTINHAIERIFAYVAQNEGYYSALVENEEYASLYISNLMSVLAEEQAKLENMRMNQLKLFSNSHQSLYIYGAGLKAKKVTRQIEQYQINIDGYVVTDLDHNPAQLMNRPVIALEEMIHSDSDYGIILALNRNNLAEVVSYLKSKKVSEYLIFE